MVLGIHYISPYEIRVYHGFQLIIMMPVEGKALGQLNSNSFIFGWLQTKQTNPK